MGRVRSIAMEEWRYWHRTRLVMVAGTIIAAVAVVSIFVTHFEMAEQRSSRQELQSAARQTFVDQPDRHPHRMVHYGHYAFRSPPPLSVLDPGVDHFTGTALFLEGHRQNSGTFPPAYDAPPGGRFAPLSSATVYQIIVPLLIVAMGFASISRERESGTDQLLMTVPVSPFELATGKAVALTLLACLLIAPLLVTVLIGQADLLAGAVLVLGYLTYLMFWVVVTVCVSARSGSSATALVTLLSVWLAFCILIPRGASLLVQVTSPVPSKLETDLVVADAVRNLGDGHNAADPAFARLRANLLAEYEVESPEELPVNIRGIVAEESEAQLKTVMDRFSARYREQEMNQVDLLRWLSVFSPALALQSYSTALAGTDLVHRHRYLEHAEEVRYRFVQDLNRIHATQLSYSDDIRRSSDPAAEQRTRVDAENWRQLDHFSLDVGPFSERFSRAIPFLILLIVFTMLVGLWGIPKRRHWVGSSS